MDIGKVGRREEGEESSAWTLCSGRPLIVGRREEGEESSAWLARLSAPRTAVLPCDTKVGRREEGEESSAWLARLGAPRTAVLPCDMKGGIVGKVECREKKGESSAWTLCSGRPLIVGRREEGEESSAWLARLSAPRTAVLPCDTKVGRREEGEESSAWLARLGAPRTAVLPCDMKGGIVGKVECREKKGESSAWTLCSGRPLIVGRRRREPHTGNARQFGRARRAQARQPRTPPFSLLPTLYLPYSCIERTPSAPLSLAWMPLAQANAAATVVK